MIKLQKLEDVTPRTTAKALEILLRGVNVERRRILLMEWAKPSMAAPGRPQSHELADDLDDVRNLSDFLSYGFW